MKTELNNEAMKGGPNTEGMNKDQLRQLEEGVSLKIDRNKDFSQAPSVLRGEGVTRVFTAGKTRTVAVDHVNFNFHKGELVK